MQLWLLVTYFLLTSHWFQHTYRTPCHGPLYLCSLTVPRLPLLSLMLQAHDTPLGSCLFHAYSYPGHLHRPFILLGSPCLSPFLPTNYGSNSSYKSLLQDCASREVSHDIPTQSDPYIHAHDSGPLSLQHETQLPAEFQFLGGYWRDLLSPHWTLHPWGYELKQVHLYPHQAGARTLCSCQGFILHKLLIPYSLTSTLAQLGLNTLLNNLKKSLVEFIIISFLRYLK